MDHAHTFKSTKALLKLCMAYNMLRLLVVVAIAISPDVLDSCAFSIRLLTDRAWVYKAKLLPNGVQPHNASNPHLIRSELD